MKFPESMNVKKTVDIVIILVLVFAVVVSSTRSFDRSEYHLSALTKDDSSSIRYTNVTFSGTLFHGASGAPGRTVYLENSTDQVTWTTLISNITEPNGHFQFTINRTTTTTMYYRARF